jgi:REP element-mobilizing transposase RayT
MRAPRLRWVHVIVNTHCSWLHGDRRGFRNRRHRIHSSGDYRNPPPPREHAGLRDFHAARSRGAVHLRFEARVRVLRAFVLKMRALGHRIIACSVGAEHLHAVVQLPSGRSETRLIVGKCKQKASHAVRDILPGTVWSRNGENRDIRDPSHLHNAFNYVRTKQERGTVVWSHRPPENWIDDDAVRVIVMGTRRTQLRLPLSPNARV